MLLRSPSGRHIGERIGHIGPARKRWKSPTIKDPTTNAPFAGNIIPANRINPTGLAYAAFFPPPNSGPNGLLVSPTGTQSDDVYLAKGDWVPTAKDRLSLRGAIQMRDFHQPIAQFSNTTNIPGFGLDQIGAHNITDGMSETHVFSPNVIAELRLGWNRFDFQYYPIDRTQDYCKALAIQGCDEARKTSRNIPQVSFSSASNLGASSGSGSQTQYGPFDTSFIDPTVTWIKGKHTLKFGGDFHYFSEHSTNGQGPRGGFTFRANTFSGNPLADLLLGLPYQATKTVVANTDQTTLSSS